MVEAEATGNEPANAKRFPESPRQPEKARATVSRSEQLVTDAPGYDNGSLTNDTFALYNE